MKRVPSLIADDVSQGENMLRHRYRFALLALLLAVQTRFCFAKETLELHVDSPPPAEVVERLKLDPFYKKHVFVGPFSIVSSEPVADAALLEAAWLIDKMIGHRPDVLEAIAKSRTRFTVMSVDEFTTQVPEHSDLTPSSYWDRRARGLGATDKRPCVTCGEENLLKYEGDPYAAENILIHEFGHVIHEMGLNKVDPEFDQRLELIYEQAMEQGLWKDKYAATNRMEYWAEGVQSWFDTNRENDSDHNHVNTRKEIKEYDPALADLLEKVFGDGDWRYTPPASRHDSPHLASWRPKQSPKFAWPKKVVARYEAYLAVKDGKDVNDDEWKNSNSLPLDQLPKIRSGRDDHSTAVLFVNRRKDGIRLYWIDFEGDRKSMGRVAAGGIRLIDTYRTHAWLVTDNNEKPLQLFVSEYDLERALLTAPEKK